VKTLTVAVSVRRAQGVPVSTLARHTPCMTACVNMISGNYCIIATDKIHTYFDMFDLLYCTRSLRHIRLTYSVSRQRKCHNCDSFQDSLPKGIDSLLENQLVAYK